MDEGIMIKLVDSHCHLDMLDLSENDGQLQPVIDRALEQGVCYLLNVCVSVNEFPTNLHTAENYSFVGTSVGLHPNDREEEVDESDLIELGRHEKVVAIGETGLDYYRSEGDLNWQRDRFRMHIRAANVLQKPLIIHTRDANEDTLKIMREENAKTGVMHCFTEDWEMALEALEMGFYISFSGIVTFKNASTIQEVAKRVPLNRMLIETDSPYLAPIPHRGKSNEPGYVIHTAEFLAALRGIPLEELAAQTTENFFRLFRGATNPYV